MLHDLTLEQLVPSADEGNVSFEFTTSEGTDSPPLELAAFRDELTVWQRDLAMAEADSQIAFMQTSMSILSSLGAELAAALEQRNQEYERLRAHVAGLLPDLTATQRVARDGGEASAGQPDAELMAEIVTLRDQVQSMKGELATTSAQKNELSVQLRQYKVELDQLSLLAAIAQSDLQILYDDKVNLEQQVSSGRQELQLRDVQIAGLEAELNLQQSNQANLEVQLAVRALELEELHKLMHEAEESVAAQQAELSAAIASRSDLEAQRAAQDETIVHFQAELIAEESALAERQVELDAQKAQVADLQEQLATVTEAGVQLQAQVVENEARIDDLSSQLSMAQAESEKSLSAKMVEIAILTTAAEEAARAIQKKTDELAAVQLQLSSQEETLRGLEARLDEASTEHAKTTEELDQRSAQITVLTEELATTKDEYEKLATAQAAGWIERLPALAEVGASLATLPASKTHAANEAIRGGVLPVVAGPPQNFTEVEGIGPVYEMRLYKAGIGTYWELAHLSDADLTEALAVTQWQLLHLDLNEIRASARQLAEQTGTVGQLWAVRKLDNLGLIPGIGEVFEQRLYSAGIYTYEELGNTTLQQLDEICHPPKFSKHNFQAWIEHAREFQEVRMQA